MGGGFVWIAIIVLAVLALLPVVALLLVRRWIARGQPATERCCGRCRYALRGVREPRCPECGADLTQIGVIMPGTRMPHRTPLWLWMIGSLTTVGVVLLAVLLLLLAAPTLRRDTRSRVWTLSVPAAAALPELSAREDVLRGGLLQAHQFVDLSLTGEGMSAAPVLRADLRRGSWSIKSPGAAEQPGQGPLDADAILAWWKSQGVDTTGADAPRAADELAQAIGALRVDLRQAGRGVVSGAPELQLRSWQANVTTGTMATQVANEVQVPLVLLAILAWVVWLVVKLRSPREVYPPAAPTVPWKDAVSSAFVASVPNSTSEAPRADGTQAPPTGSS